MRPRCLDVTGGCDDHAGMSRAAAGDKTGPAYAVEVQALTKSDGGLVPNGAGLAIRYFRWQPRM